MSADRSDMTCLVVGCENKCEPTALVCPRHTQAWDSLPSKGRSPVERNRVWHRFLIEANRAA